MSSVLSLKRESTELIATMEQILSDQVGVECPACDGGRNYLPIERERGKRIDRLIHEDTCVIRRARQFLGKDEEEP